MADNRSSQPTWNIRPRMPVRKWYQYLPIFRQGYEDQLSRYQQDYDQWALSEQLKYNDPASVMARYKEAGLNPNLVYGDISSGNAGTQQKPLEFQKPNQTSDPTGMVLGRFMDAKMKMAQIKDVEAAASLKSAQRDDLLAEIGAKDTLWYNRKGLKVDPRTLTPRQRKYYVESMEKLSTWSQELSKATTEQRRAEILTKINEVQNLILFMNMVTGMGSMLSRFDK